MKPPVNNKELGSGFRYGLGFITVVLVALYLQKGSDASIIWTMSLLALAAAGCLMVNTAVIAILTRGRPHDHRLRRVMERPVVFVAIGLIGLGCLVASFIAIDDNPSRRIPEPASDQDHTDTSVSLRDPQHGINDQSIRFLVSILNKTTSTVLLNEAEFAISSSDPDSRCGEPGNVYSVSQAITVQDGTLKDLRVDALEGPFAGYSVDAQGSLEDLCNHKAIRLKFPVSISLAPAESTHLALDVPRALSVVQVDSDSNPKRPNSGAPTAVVQQSLPVSLDDPNTAFSVRIRYENEPWACISVKMGGGATANDCH